MRALPVVLAVVFAFAAGALVGHELASAPRGAPAIDESTMACTREDLAELKRELVAELRARTADTPLSSVEREPAASTNVSPDRDRLRELVARLEVLAERGVAGSGGAARSAPGWRTGRGTGYGTIEEIWAAQRKAWAAGENEYAELQALYRHFALWTADDAVNAFGAPVRVTHADGLTLHYGAFPIVENDGAEPVVYELTFQFKNGFFAELGEQERDP